MKCPDCHSSMDMEFEDVKVECIFFDKTKKRSINYSKPGRLYACMECGEEWSWTKGEKFKRRSGDTGEQDEVREILWRETAAEGADEDYD